MLENLFNANHAMRTQTALQTLTAALLLAGCTAISIPGYDENGISRGAGGKNLYSTGFAQGTGTISRSGNASLTDFANTADAMLKSLFASAAFSNARHWDGGPPVLLLGRIRNESREAVDTEVLAKKVAGLVNRSGNARLAAGSARSWGDLRADDSSSENLTPDFTLNGKLLSARPGSVSQSGLTLQLSLVDDKSGTPVWQDEKPLGKQSPGVSEGF